MHQHLHQHRSPLSQRLRYLCWSNPQNQSLGKLFLLLGNLILKLKTHLKKKVGSVSFFQVDPFSTSRFHVCFLKAEIKCRKLLNFQKILKTDKFHYFVFPERNSKVQLKWSLIQEMTRSLE